MIGSTDPISTSEANTDDRKVSRKGPNAKDNEELEELKRECHVMAETLRRLRKEEHILKTHNEMIARMAVDAGYVQMSAGLWRAKKDPKDEEKSQDEKKARKAVPL